MISFMTKLYRYFLLIIIFLCYTFCDTQINILFICIHIAYIIYIKCRFPQQAPVYTADESALSVEMWVNHIRRWCECFVCWDVGKPYTFGCWDFTLNYGCLVIWITEKSLVRMQTCINIGRNDFFEWLNKCLECIEWSFSIHVENKSTFIHVNE